jgi:hypothetical protein
VVFGACAPEAMKACSTSKRNFEARDKAANTAEPTYAFLSRDNKRRDNAREWRAFSAASGNIWLRENAWWRT